MCKCKLIHVRTPLRALLSYQATSLIATWTIRIKRHSLIEGKDFMFCTHRIPLTATSNSTLINGSSNSYRGTLGPLDLIHSSVSIFRFE